MSRATPPATTSEAVSAEPTKDFFISMLVRDIGLIPAIVDLVDNSVDGARRLRDTPINTASVGNQRFKDLWVAIRTDAHHFEIQDNCGGIPWQIARDYAFRFGRPLEAPATPHSIGQFGIGMKRALFKMGSQFIVQSTTLDERFELRVDVAAWRQLPEWTFSDATHTTQVAADDAVGTRIKVTALHEAVRDTFVQQRFQTELSNELSRMHQSSMNDGLKITLNGIPVDVNLLTLLQSDVLRPAHISPVLDEESDTPVRVELYAGLDVSSPSEAGWYVYCNGRLILGPDRTNETGWGEGNGRTIPQFHNQFARFRGYAFFESSNVEKLPWTTTKEGVDAGHRIYRAVRPQMIALMRPVITFLNALDAEKDNPAKGKESLESIVTSAEAGRSPLANVPISNRFVTPERPPQPKKPETQSIQYSRPVAEINLIKKKLRLSSARQAGEATFDYFLRQECGYGE